MTFDNRKTERATDKRAVFAEAAERHARWRATPPRTIKMDPQKTSNAPPRQHLSGQRRRLASEVSA